MRRIKKKNCNYYISDNFMLCIFIYLLYIIYLIQIFLIKYFLLKKFVHRCEFMKKKTIIQL